MSHFSFSKDTLLRAGLALAACGFAFTAAAAAPEPAPANPTPPTQEAPALTDQERQAALDLAKLFQGKAQYATQDHMARTDDPPSKFPFDRVKEAAKLKPAQLFLLLQAIGKDESISAPNRAVTMGTIADGWVKRPENKDPKQVRPLLDCLYELVKPLGDAWDALPITGVAKSCVAWNAEACTDFVVAHWDDWPKNHALAAPGVTTVRNAFLGYITDEKQIERLKALPKKPNEQ